MNEESPIYERKFYFLLFLSACYYCILFCHACKIVVQELVNKWLNNLCFKNVMEFIFKNQLSVLAKLVKNIANKFLFFQNFLKLSNFC